MHFYSYQELITINYIRGLPKILMGFVQISEVDHGSKIVGGVQITHQSPVALRLTQNHKLQVEIIYSHLSLVKT